MSRIPDVKTIYGALKLIEQLYNDGWLPEYVYRGVLADYDDQVNTLDFMTEILETRKVKEV